MTSHLLRSLQSLSSVDALDDLYRSNLLPTKFQNPLPGKAADWGLGAGCGGEGGRGGGSAVAVSVGGYLCEWHEHSWKNDPTSNSGMNQRGIANTTHSKAIKQVQGVLCVCSCMCVWCGRACVSVSQELKVKC